MIDKVLGVGESTDSITIFGNCDVIVEGLSSGSVKLQYKLTATTELPSPQWKDFPSGTFSSDVFKTVHIAGSQVEVRLTGVSNNAGVYVRIDSF